MLTVRNRPVIHTWLDVFLSYEYFFVASLILIRKFNNERISFGGIDFSIFIFGLLVIVGIVTLLYRVKAHTKAHRLHLVAMLSFVAWISWTVLTLFWSPLSQYGLNKAVRIIAIVGWAYFSGLFIVGLDKKAVLKFVRSWLFFGVIIAAVSLLLYLWVGASAFYGSYGASYLGFGRVIAIALVVVTSCFLTGKYFACGFRPILLLLLAGLMSANLLLLGGRGPMLSALIAFLTVAIASKKFHKVFLFIIMLGFATIPFFRFLHLEARTIERIQILFVAEEGGQSAVGRLERWHNAYTLFMEHPLIGTGLGSFYVYFSPPTLSADYPHNLLLETASETGLLGLALLALLLLLPFFKLSIHKLQQDFLLNSLFMLLITTFMFSMISGDLADNRYFFATLGVFTGYVFKELKEFKY